MPVDNYVRFCDKCGKTMTKGFCIGDGLEYYCSEECLFSRYTKREYIDMYETDQAYWTEWDEEDSIQVTSTFPKLQTDILTEKFTYCAHECEYATECRNEECVLYRIEQLIMEGEN